MQNRLNARQLVFIKNKILKEALNFMRQRRTYETPEFCLFLLNSDDVMKASTAVDSFSNEATDNLVVTPGSGWFGGI